MANYLYNGIELPALPEWDKTAYPYGVIVQNSTIGYMLCVKTTGFKISTGDAFLVGPTTNCVKFRLTDGEWTTSNLSATGTVIWANHDVLYASTHEKAGEVAIAASEPVPVSTFTPDPASLTMGWLVGRRIAGQRTKGATE